MAGTALAMLGSFYLLLARHASEGEKQSEDAKKPGQQSHCPNCDDGCLVGRSPPPRAKRRMSLPNQRIRRRSEAFLLDLPIQSIELSRISEPIAPRPQPSDRSSSANSKGEPTPHSMSSYRQKIEGFFFKAGEILGTPARDFITEPDDQKKHYVDVPTIPGEWVRNPRMAEVDEERGEYEGDQVNPLRSRASSFNGSIRSSKNASGAPLRLSVTLPPEVHRRAP